jgi:pyruvate kinase
MRLTKVIATVGPAIANSSSLKGLLKAGVDGFRFNLAHGKLEDQQRLFDDLRCLDEESGSHTAILIDIPGPKVRLEGLKKKVLCEGGQEIALSRRSTPNSLYLNFEHFFDQVEKGDKILLGDGAVELKVLKTSSSGLKARIEVGGWLSPRMGVTLVGKPSPLSALTEKDRQLLRETVQWQPDWFGLSFVSSGDDIEKARRVLGKDGKGIAIMAKIERAEAIENLEGIVEMADGVMVARGDLGLKLPLEEVPLLQKKIINLARSKGKVVVTATQILESMIFSSRPTRAEVSDVANAILDGTDALMLSAETAVGKYPRRAVEVMNRLIERTEESGDYLSQVPDAQAWSKQSLTDGIGFAACKLAQSLGAQAIATLTYSGETARRVARFRPPVPILAITPILKTARSLSLSWGVKSILVPIANTLDEMLKQARQAIKGLNFFPTESLIVITAGTFPQLPGSTNLIKVEKV